MSNESEIEEISFKRRPPKETAIFIWANATTFSKIVGIIVLILAVFSLAQSWYSRDQYERVLECQADFVTQVAESINTRSAANQDSFAAIDEIIGHVNDALETGDFDPLDAYLDEYEAIRAQANEDKAGAQLPNISVAAECGG